MPIPLSRPPVEVPNLSSRKKPGFGLELDQIKSPLASGGGGTMVLPFSITDVSPDAMTPTINVVFGTVMDIPPTDIATPIEIDDDETNTVYLENTLDADGNVTASAVMFTTGALPDSDDDTAILLIGIVVVASGVITSISQSLYFSQGFKACDRDPGDPATTPGTYEFFVR